MHYLSSYSTAHYTLWYWAHHTNYCLKTLHLNNLDFVPVPWQNKYCFKPTLQNPASWKIQSPDLDNLESQTWKWFQLFLTNFESLGCVDGWVGCAAAPKKKSWLENKKPPHWSGESFLNIWIMCRKYCNYVTWFVMLFRTLCQSLQCCGKTRHVWEKSVVNDFGLFLSIQLFDVVLWTGSSGNCCDWLSHNETESLVLIESKCFM